jgi:hypothetical protein
MARKSGLTYRESAWPAAGKRGSPPRAVWRIQVREVLNQEDRNPLLDSASVTGLVVPIPGWCDLLNAVVRSTGHLEVILDSESRIVPRAAR